MQKDSLKYKAIKGAGWSAIDNVANYAVTFVVGIILARILSPEDYGLLGIIGIFTAICDCLINAGFGSALIRKKEATDDDYNTVFFCNLCTSIVLYGVLFLSAPLISTFFGREELVNLTRVTSLGLIIGALAFVQRTRMTKNIDFKSQTKITIVTSVFRSIIGISLAVSGFGVWALVIQGLSGSILSTSLLWFYNRWIPKLYFSLQSFKELFGYSSKMLASSLLDTLWREIYQVVIGKCYAPATLGLYSRATAFSSLFSSNLSAIVSRVSFPVLSEMQDNKERLRGGYRRIIRTSMLISFSCMLMLVAVSKSMVLVLIGEKWVQSAYFLQVVCFSSMMHPLQSLNLNMLQVQGRSDLFLKLEVIKKAIAVGPLLLGIYIDIYWMLGGSVLTSIVSYYLNSYYSGPLIGYGIKQQILDILPSFWISATAAIAAFIPRLFVDSFIEKESFMISSGVLSCQLLIGFSVIYTLLEKTRIPEYIEVKELICSGISKIYKRKV